MYFKSRGRFSRHTCSGTVCYGYNTLLKSEERSDFKRCIDYIVLFQTYHILNGLYPIARDSVKPSRANFDEA